MYFKSQMFPKFANKTKLFGSFSATLVVGILLGFLINNFFSASARVPFDSTHCLTKYSYINKSLGCEQVNVLSKGEYINLTKN